MNQLMVHGNVTRNDSHEGVHGLTIEVWDGHGCEERCLGTDLTNRDGSYTVRFCPPGDGCPIEPFLRVRDREARVIREERPQGCRPPLETSIALDVALAPETLWWHLTRPLSWSAPESKLIDPRIVEEIGEAITTFWPDRDSDVALCAVPSIVLFDDLLSDAWDTLQGGLDAADRFRDALRALCSAGADGCGCSQGDSSVAELEEIFRSACPEEPACGAPEASGQDPAASGGGDHGRGTGPGCGGDCGCGCEELPTDPRCPGTESPVAADDVMVLVMAALHISCRHTPTAMRYVATLLDQVCRLEYLGALHHAAAKALCGDELSRRHFGDLLDFLAVRCDCVVGGSAVCSATSPCCSVCIDDDLARCVRDAVCAWRDAGCFRVTDIEPERACPGDTVTVRGEGFGPSAGTVTFGRYGGGGPGLVVAPTSWCCDVFTVVVPPGAGCGLSVQLPPETLRVCDRFLEYRRFGSLDDEFVGTGAEILKFNVEGRENGDCIEPGTPLEVTWKTCASDRVRVEVLDLETGNVIDALDPAPDRGRWTFDGTGFNRTTRVRVRVSAEGICAPLTVDEHLSLVYQARPDLDIEGLEVTQAIQHYRSDQHLTDPADRGLDNSLRLVTDKTAWVRAYLRSGQLPTFDGGVLENVDGTLTVERRDGGIWNTIASISSQNGPIDAQDDFVTYDAERGNIDTTLNFVIPANVMTGLLRLTVRAASPFDCPGNSASRTTMVDVNLRQTLNAAFITIGYDGPDNAGTGTLTLPAPDLPACQAETSWAMTTYPVSGVANVRIAGSFVTATPLNDPRSGPGTCSPNWTPLLAQIAGLVTLDQAANPGNWAYYGIIANGIPVTVPGCNGAATGGIAGRPMTYAHEIGHQFGLPHARCGRTGTGNPTYPVYEPYDLPVDVPANPVSSTNWTMASIGEYGLDINNGNIANPALAEDFMSYCGPRWISRFTHDYLVNDARLDPVVVPTGAGGARDRVIRDDEPGFERTGDEARPMIVMLGEIDSSEDVYVTDVVRLSSRYIVGDGRPSGYRAMLIGEEGEVLAVDDVYRYSTEGCCGDDGPACCDGCGERDEFVFKVMLDDVAPGASLRITKDGETVWERKRPDGPPKVSRARAALTKDDLVRVSWSSSCSGVTESAWIRWSDDDGESWHALTVGVTGKNFELPLKQSPCGRVAFQIFVNDGFATAEATTAVLEIADQPPAVTVFHPREADVVYAERQIHLWGAATTFAGRSAADEDFTWSIDGAEIGRGPDIWVNSPGVGEHSLELSVGDPESGATVVRNRFVVRG